VLSCEQSVDGDGIVLFQLLLLSLQSYAFAPKVYGSQAATTSHHGILLETQAPIRTNGTGQWTFQRRPLQPSN